jgi:acyl dehydratase
MAWKSIHWDDVAEGDELPPQTREISRTTIVATAVATRDFTPVHHDHEAAQREGAKDIFLNILSTGGFIGKYLTDWSGPEGEIKKITIKLGATVFPGDSLATGGKVTGKYTEGDQHLVDVDFNLTVPMGPHAWGTATMALPAKG